MIFDLWKISSVKKKNINIVNRENNILTVHNRPLQYLLLYFLATISSVQSHSLLLYLCTKLLTQNSSSNGNVSSFCNIVLVTYAWYHRFRSSWMTRYAVKWFAQTYTVTKKRKSPISASAKLIRGKGMRLEPNGKTLSTHFKSCLMTFVAVVEFAPNGLLS